MPTHLGHRQVMGAARPYSRHPAHEILYDISVIGFQVIDGVAVDVDKLVDRDARDDQQDCTGDENAVGLYTSVVNEVVDQQVGAIEH